MLSTKIPAGTKQDVCADVFSRSWKSNFWNYCAPDLVNPPPPSSSNISIWPKPSASGSALPCPHPCLPTQLDTRAPPSFNLSAAVTGGQVHGVELAVRRGQRRAGWSVAVVCICMSMQTHTYTQIGAEANHKCVYVCECRKGGGAMAPQDGKEGK